MKRTLTLMLMGTMVWQLAAGNAGKTTSQAFETDPNVKVTKLADPDDKNLNLCKAVIPVPNSGKTGFIGEFNFTIKKFHHYGKVSMGFANSSKNAYIKATFRMLDDRIRRCHFTCQLAPGITVKAKPMENLDAGSYRIRMQYLAAKKTVRWVVMDSNGKSVYDSGDKKVAGTFTIDQFVVEAADQKKGSDFCEISYDPAEKALFFRSYIGGETNYPYLIEGYLNDLTVNYPAE